MNQSMQLAPRRSHGHKIAAWLGRLPMALMMLASLALVGASSVHAEPFAYVANNSADTVSVVDTATENLVATVPVGSGPWGVAFTPDGTKAYVTNRYDDTVSVIDTATDTVVTTIPIPMGYYPESVAITPDGTKAYVSYWGGVHVIDTATDTVVTTVPVSAIVLDLAITPDGTRVYLTTFESGNLVGVIDTATDTLVETFYVAFYYPSGVAITPDGTRAYVVDSYEGTISVIDTSNNTVVTTVPVGSWPTEVAITPDGSKAYITNGGDDTVSVIDTATDTVVATVPVGVNPFGVAFTQDGAKAYVTNSGDDTVSVIDTATDSVIATVPVGARPHGIAVMPTTAPPTPEQAITSVLDLQDLIASLDPASFSNINRENTFLNMLDAAVNSILAGLYDDTLILLDSILDKTNGCALTGAPDSNDWIIDCTDQEPVYTGLLAIIEQVTAL